MFFIPLFLVSRVSSFVYSSTTAVKAVRLAVCFTLYAQRDEKGDFFFRDLFSQVVVQRTKKTSDAEKAEKT